MVFMQKIIKGYLTVIHKYVFQRKKDKLKSVVNEQIGYNTHGVLNFEKIGYFLFKQCSLFVWSCASL